MPPQNLPAADVPVDEDVVRRLLTAQHPDLADLPSSSWPTAGTT